MRVIERFCYKSLIKDIILHMKESSIMRNFLPPSRLFLMLHNSKTFL